jgi:hypothetical protein
MCAFRDVFEMFSLDFGKSLYDAKRLKQRFVELRGGLSGGFACAFPALCRCDFHTIRCATRCEAILNNETSNPFIHKAASRS